MPRWYFPFVDLFLDQVGRIHDADLPSSVKVRLLGLLVGYELRDKAIKALVKTTGRICPEKYKETVGTKVYWRFFHSPNIEAEATPIYVDRIIKPMLGWWR